MRTLTMAVAVLASVTLVAEAGAQTQVPTPTGQNSPPLGEQTPAQEGEEKTVEGQVGSSSRTEITLTDGTKLVTPPVVIRPGVLTEGVIVIASYREQNGEKVMTGIAVKGKKPSDSPKQN